MWILPQLIIAHKVRCLKDSFFKSKKHRNKQRKNDVFTVELCFVTEQERNIVRLYSLVKERDYVHCYSTFFDHMLFNWQGFHLCYCFTEHFEKHCLGEMLREQNIIRKMTLISKNEFISGRACGIWTRRESHKTDEWQNCAFPLNTREVQKNKFWKTSS